MSPGDRVLHTRLGNVTFIRYNMFTYARALVRLANGLETFVDAADLWGGEEINPAEFETATGALR